MEILTPTKPFTRLPVVLAKLKAGNNLYTLKCEIRKIVYLLNKHNKITKKTLQQFNQVIIIMADNRTVKNIHFDLPKGVDKDLQYEIDFITKHNKF